MRRRPLLGSGHGNTTELKFPKIQVLTIEQLVDGNGIHCAYVKHGSPTFKKGGLRSERPWAETGELPLDQ